MFTDPTQLSAVRKLTASHPNVVAQIDTINFNIPILDQYADLIEQLAIIAEQRFDDFRPDKLRHTID